MRTLMASYVKKFNCLGHCYTFHNTAEVWMWEKWGEVFQVQLKPLRAGASSKICGSSPRDENSTTFGPGECSRKRGRNHVSSGETPRVLGRRCEYETHDNSTGGNCAGRGSPIAQDHLCMQLRRMNT
ncbi:hypothetical protein TRVL_02163 [Trypanosoma vivax]|nr:hypothetical protein TRVL_02163 [Trypanosoma vivax]